MARQIAAIYQLQRYGQYAFASVSVLQLLSHPFDLEKSSLEGAEHLKKIIIEAVKKLTNN